MQRQKDSVNLMTFIKPHQSGFLLSIILAVISVTSGIVPYFAVARIVNLLIGGETNFSTYLTWGIVALIAYLMKSVFVSEKPSALHPRKVGISVTAEGRSMLERTMVKTVSRPFQAMRGKPKAHRELVSTAPMVAREVINRELRR